MADPPLENPVQPPVSNAISTTTPPSSNPILSSLPHLVTVKLINDNYLLWHTQLLPYVYGQRLFGYSDGFVQSLAQFLTDNLTMNPAFSLLVSTRPTYP